MAKKPSGFSLNKIAFYTLAVAALAYLVIIILAAVGGYSAVVGWMSMVATVVVYCIAAVLAWRYVANKQPVWKVLYIFVVLVLIVGIVLPVCLTFA